MSESHNTADEAAFDEFCASAGAQDLSIKELQAVRDCARKIAARYNTTVTSTGYEMLRVWVRHGNKPGLAKVAGSGIRWLAHQTPRRASSA